MSDTAPKRRCSFCNKDEADVQRLIQANTKDIFICDECVLLCWDIVAGKFDNIPKVPTQR